MTKRIPEGTSILSALAADEIKLHLDALALKWSEERGEPITRSDVMRALLVEGVERNPVSEDLRQAAARGKRAAARAPRLSRARQILRVVDTSGEDTTSPRGVVRVQRPGSPALSSRAGARGTSRASESSCHSQAGQAA